MPQHAPLTIAPEDAAALRIRRRFHAPRKAVWTAFTDPSLVRQWLYARDYPMITCEMDFREGGRFVWGWAIPQRPEMIVRGRFVAIDPPRRIVHTELFDEDWTDGETTVTTLFLDEGEATLMDMHVLYSSSRARDAAARTPMAEGMEEGYARLDGLLPGWSRGDGAFDSDA
ncbi:SRPBCC domain-containing protein [Palleronia sp. KMU-117]|uniref:SRPBCC domain-containing protein n=1 Tax=Palleronia sp. KMU-117 TaxID=3434108 RepID=UPI003D71F510